MSSSVATHPSGYIVDSHHDHIRRFDVDQHRNLSGGDVIAQSTAGQFDGIRIDIADNIWAAAEDGVHCLTADGALDRQDPPTRTGV